MEKQIGSTTVRMQVRGSRQVFIVKSGPYDKKPATIIWDGTKWVDDNKGQSYLGWRMREQIVKAFGLK